MEVGIIGGKGDMGRWFGRFFENQGYSVHIADKDEGMSLEEMGKRCSVVLVSVPVSVTTEVIERIGPVMGKDALLMDITSLKVEPVDAMLRCAECDVIGTHPLFGPEVPSMDGYSFVLCPVRPGSGKWLAWLLRILKKNGARLVETSPEEHDRFMGIIQGLNHFNTMTFGLAMTALGTDIEALKPYMTPIFEEKIRIIKEVFSHNARMYSEILTRNPYLPVILESYEQTVKELKNLIDIRDAKTLEKQLQDAGNRFPEMFK
ncbi:prephenate dehydrogenase [Syntrophus gentianae]|uniref:Prephenate dehydrogenase n=1 Tax=Syntrophus gentianae TaxID=43775 RepID=A0A1H7W3E1_9BACT|nr:prephenate dehydrogenase/arogenate dehydrogenase family protein [Syntrophus gentianae]SEM15507.1 prephenate dehydrogenase [Syntrophus gentianae]